MESLSPSFNSRVPQTALHLVASKARLDIARILMSQDPPASCRFRDKRGQYPIHRAAAVGSTPMVTLLLEHKSPLDATDTSGYTALHHAIAEGHGAEPVVRADRLAPPANPRAGDAAVTLLKAGADSTKREGEGWLAMDLAPDREVRQQQAHNPYLSS
ncbi:ankyrin repeat domain-containing protein [Candidatus Bathyarchaeota archaeon]|nr:ankyrin repeat domain-containing protein [Candidatus Bathyarchaeota archaeon]